MRAVRRSRWSPSIVIVPAIVSAPAIVNVPDYFTNLSIEESNFIKIVQKNMRDKPLKVSELAKKINLQFTAIPLCDLVYCCIFYFFFLIKSSLYIILLYKYIHTKP